MVNNQKKNRVLDIFDKAFKGEELSVSNLASEYEVSTKSITRDINEIKNFLADNRDVVGNSELLYSYQSKTYSLKFDHFLVSKELVASAFQLALCVRVVGINKTFVFIMCFLEMILLFIIGFHRLNNERKLELEMYNKVIEKRMLLKNINVLTSEREEYLFYLDDLLKKATDTLKIK